VLPPYVITREELHFVYDVILQGIEAMPVTKEAIYLNN